MSWFNKLSITGLWNNGSPAPVSESDPLPTSVSEDAVTAFSLTTSSSGTTNVKAPASGKSIRLYWWGLSASPTNSAAVIAGLRWTAGGTNFVTVPLSQYGGIFAHGYKGGRSYVQGGVDEALVLSLDSAQTVSINIDYEEV